MKGVVSKARTKKTKKRQKQADRGGDKSPLLRRPVVGVLIVLVVWLAAMFLLGLEDILTGNLSLEFLLPYLGNGALMLVGLVASGLLLSIVRPSVLAQNSRILILALVCVLPITAGRLLLYMAHGTGLIPTDIANFLLPFALAPLLVTILMGGAAGIAAGVWTALALALFSDIGLPMFMTGAVASVVAARTAYRARTRSKVIRTGLVVGLSQIACVFAVTAIDWQDRDVMLVINQAGACLVSGFVSALIALLILPLFEAVFRITTDITLLEISDLGHPLLQRLAIEAPGTYHHSLVVANLAAAAADEIGANSLLARICAYYHDIGKLTKPNFFAENIHLQNNPHDDLPPSMSTLVITAHVKEGLSLALVHKLPDPVQDVIREHHGTSLISCFHHKAKSQLEFELGRRKNGSQTNGNQQVDEGSFRYPGPKPSFKESAIISLADSVEAASRSLEKTTPGHLEGLVNDLTFAKLRDGQLDNCDLTLAELDRIKRSFVFTLTNMLHGRLAYPKDEDRDQKPAEDAADESPPDSPPDGVPDATGGRERTRTDTE